MATGCGHGSGQTGIATGCGHGAGQVTGAGMATVTGCGHGHAAGYASGCGDGHGAGHATGCGHVGTGMSCVTVTVCTVGCTGCTTTGCGQHGFCPNVISPMLTIAVTIKLVMAFLICLFITLLHVSGSSQLPRTVAL